MVELQININLIEKLASKTGLLRLLDLTVWFFFLWGYLKPKVYSSPLTTDNKLMRLI